MIRGLCHILKADRASELLHLKALRQKELLELLIKFLVLLKVTHEQQPELLMLQESQHVDSGVSQLDLGRIDP